MFEKISIGIFKIFLRFFFNIKTFLNNFFFEMTLFLEIVDILLDISSICLEHCAFLGICSSF